MVVPFSEMGRKERKGRTQKDSGGNSLCYWHAKFKVSISHLEIDVDRTVYIESEVACQTTGKHTKATQEMNAAPFI